MICDKCKYTATPLVEVIIDRYEDHEDYHHAIQTTETEEWCLTCITGKERAWVRKKATEKVEITPRTMVSTPNEGW